MTGRETTARKEAGWSESERVTVTRVEPGGIRAGILA